MSVRKTRLLNNISTIFDYLHEQILLPTNVSLYNTGLWCSLTEARAYYVCVCVCVCVSCLVVSDSLQPHRP